MASSMCTLRFSIMRWPHNGKVLALGALDAAQSWALSMACPGADQLLWVLLQSSPHTFELVVLLCLYKQACHQSSIK